MHWPTQPWTTNWPIIPTLVPALTISISSGNVLMSFAIRLTLNLRAFSVAARWLQAFRPFSWSIFASFYLLRCYTAFASPPGALAILRGARCSASQAGCQNLSDGLFHFISFNLFHLIVSQIVQGALSGLDSQCTAFDQSIPSLCRFVLDPVWPSEAEQKSRRPSSLPGRKKKRFSFFTTNETKFCKCTTRLPAHQQEVENEPEINQALS